MDIIYFPCVGFTVSVTIWPIIYIFFQFHLIQTFDLNSAENGRFDLMAEDIGIRPPPVLTALTREFTPVRIDLFTPKQENMFSVLFYFSYSGSHESL